MRHVMGLILVIWGAGMMLAEAQTKYEIALPHLRLRWDAATGLEVSAEGQLLLTLPVSPVVAYPPGWAWSYAAGVEHITACLEKKGRQHILTVVSSDSKLPWTQTIEAGPEDRYVLRYTFQQLGWDAPMNYEVCAARPTPLFVGGSWTAKGPGGTRRGVIPLQFAGQSNPFVEATEAEFSFLSGRLAFKATAGLTLYDYKERQHFWLGRDGPLPRGQKQSWAVEFRFMPQPFIIQGVEISRIQLPLQPTSDTAELKLQLRRVAEESPLKLTMLWGERQAGAATAQMDIQLRPQPQSVRLAVPELEPGVHSLGFTLKAGANVLYESPAFNITIPRLLVAKANRVPLTPQDKAALLVWADPKAGDSLMLRVEKEGGGSLYQGPISAGAEASIPLDAGQLPLGRVSLKLTLLRQGQRIGSASCVLWLARAPAPANAVVIDNRSRTLLVEGLPFCPQSCYTDLNSVDDVIETEPVFGFNTIAPYLSTNFAERSRPAYRERVQRMMDRCAQVGLKVHLCLNGIARPPHTEEKWQALKEEIEAFRHHPALLAYYLADEPELGSASPQDCELAYNKIKEWDPWHPVTIVFCLPGAAARYARAMDICMTDPYPIPHSSVTRVKEYCERINQDLGEMLPLWVVPQAFGGGEAWRREPSRQEERVMTYLALIYGATGIQYFIRRVPAGNPTSPDLWSECRRLMLELAQLTPALAGERLTLPEALPPEIHAAIFRERGALTVLLANVSKQPRPFELKLPTHWTGEAEVLFENRMASVRKGRLVDLIEGMGTCAYRLQIEAPPADIACLHPKNLIVNPSFEEAANVGTPDGSYLSYYGADKAATWFVDPRTAVHGRQSLRLHTPVEGKGLAVQPFPVKLTPGHKYVLSVWAKGAQEGQKFRLTMDSVTPEQGTHQLTTQWREYRMEFTASDNAKNRISPVLRLLSAGSAHFDLLQLVPLD